MQGKQCAVIDRAYSSFLQTETSGAVADLLQFGICQIRQGEQQIRGRLFVFDRDVAIAFQPAVGAADHGGRSIVPIMGIAVAHAAAEVNDRAIQKRAVAVGGVLEFTDELRQLLRHDRSSSSAYFSMPSGLSP